MVFDFEKRNEEAEQMGKKLMQLQEEAAVQSLPTLKCERGYPLASFEYSGKLRIDDRIDLSKEDALRIRDFITDVLGEE